MSGIACFTFCSCQIGTGGRVRNGSPRWGALALVVALFIELAHTFARTGAVASITETTGKLLIPSALSLYAGAVVGKSASRARGLAWLPWLVAVVTIFVWLQAGIYRDQRVQTKEYLSALILRKNPNTQKDVMNLTGKVVGELVDADFLPDSLGNHLSGDQRKKTRTLVAEWLTKVMGIPCTEEELLVPQSERAWSIGLYSTFGVFVILAAFFYLGILLFSGVVELKETKHPAE